MFGDQVANAAVVRKRQNPEAFFAMLSGRHVGAILQRPTNARINAVSHSWWAGDSDHQRLAVRGHRFGLRRTGRSVSAIVNAGSGEPRLFRD